MLGPTTPKSRQEANFFNQNPPLDTLKVGSGIHDVRKGMGILKIDNTYMNCWDAPTIFNSLQSIVNDNIFPITITFTMPNDYEAFHDIGGIETKVDEDQQQEQKMSLPGTQETEVRSLPRTQTEAERNFQKVLKESSDDANIRRSLTLSSSITSNILTKTFEMLKTDDNRNESQEKMLLYEFCESIKNLSATNDSQIKICEAKRENLENYLSREIFTVTISHGFQRIRKLCKQNFNDMSIEKNKLLLNMTSCDAMISKQEEIITSLIPNNDTNRQNAYNEIFLYMNQVLYEFKDTKHKNSMVNQSDLNHYDRFIKSLEQSLGIKTLTGPESTLLRVYWLSNLANVIIGLICLQIEKDFMHEQIRSLIKSSSGNDYQTVLDEKIKNALVLYRAELNKMSFAQNNNNNYNNNNIDTKRVLKKAATFRIGNHNSSTSSLYNDVIEEYNLQQNVSQVKSWLLRIKSRLKMKPAEMMYSKIVNSKKNHSISSKIGNITDHLIPPTTLEMFYWNETGSPIEQENKLLSKLVKKLNDLRSNNTINEADKTALEAELLQKIEKAQQKIADLTIQIENDEKNNRHELFKLEVELKQIKEQSATTAIEMEEKKKRIQEIENKILDLKLKNKELQDLVNIQQHLNERLDALQIIAKKNEEEFKEFKNDRKRRASLLLQRRRKEKARLRKEMLGKQGSSNEQEVRVIPLYRRKNIPPPPILSENKKDNVVKDGDEDGFI